MRTLLVHFIALGIVPLLADYDPLKTVALRWSEDWKFKRAQPSKPSASPEAMGDRAAWAAPQPSISPPHSVGDE